ncbi:hypothetical protein [Zhihengliuella halotolerans]|uniref:hypothetical protein n=1 Tax=Zhihengliuella halotolerans TaxID=370736 RepID=UPI000C80EC6D|nr:hypothetical protein [Zhihengliuella halotolerans]
MSEDEKLYRFRVELEDGTTIHGKPCTHSELISLADAMSEKFTAVQIANAGGDGRQFHIIPTRNIVMITYTDEEA